MLKMNFGTFATGLLSIWLYASCAYATDEAKDDSSQIEDNGQFNLTHVESSTTSIEVAWSVAFEVETFVVVSQKEGSDATTRSGVLSGSNETYTIEDLVVYTPYHVCVEATLEDNSVRKKCENMATIRRIRDDSLIALFCALGYIFLCALIGFLVWKYNQKKQEEPQEDEEPINPKGEE